MRKQQYQIPFDDSGMQQYPAHYVDGFRWEDNREFEETLTLTGYSRGRSAAGFEFRDSQGKCYYMFLTDMVELVTGNVLDHGKITGTWTFCKRGANYGVRLVRAAV